MSDRHVRRNGDDYGNAFLTLLPDGQAWPKGDGSTLQRACIGLAYYWGEVDRIAALLLERESDPRKTMPVQGIAPNQESGLLTDWERNWGLPDPCYPTPGSVEERQEALVQRMTLQGTPSREFYIGIAEELGYTITITEFRPFVVGFDRVGDSRTIGDVPPSPMLDEYNRPILNPMGVPVADGEMSEWPHYGLGPDTNRFVWQVHVGTSSLTWFRCGVGQCGVDPHLRIGLADNLECILERWKPGHTEIVYDYSGLGTPGDPMAGTP